jgi:hypothetical protein
MIRPITMATRKAEMPKEHRWQNERHAAQLLDFGVDKGVGKLLSSRS